MYIIADAGADGWSHLRASLPTPILCYPTLLTLVPPSIYNIYRILELFYLDT